MLQAYETTDSVPAPVIIGVAPPLVKSTEIRSLEARIEVTVRGASFRAKMARISSDRFILPIALSDLEKKRKSRSIVPGLEKVCEELLQQKVPQCKTAQFYDCDMKLPMVYLGVRTVSQGKAGEKVEEKEVQEEEVQEKVQMVERETHSPEKDYIGRDDYEKASFYPISSICC
jgi:hypothetical protein